MSAAVSAAADLGVWMVNVHASGGSKMMKAAKEILKPFHNNGISAAGSLNDTEEKL